ncbi:DMT family transporter [Pseudobacteriovorax antillogorgiicola]|uniref:Transporter family-2 protein n=1 Tax=Pseudobacteriovorax antillogorgiicola TaxID=1513793 RepID=A0A1Y6C6R7_9BACT|nr:DMT family transporter [Pseudobacteriovorax antillogorgiicola]TCS50650.1 transporter family-2 protein [Pseudobacteriovorax antillogorgiicola]SMF39697.1 transporter family-2 protein [Pseudobacteriovorax antillogorgiicola]
MTLAINIIVLIIGGLLALQGVINAKLSSYLPHPLQAAVISFSVGTTVLLALSLLTGESPPSLSQWRSIPWYLFIGGLLGALMVSSAILLIPKIGATSFIGGIIVGQLIAALLLDHFGVLGLDIRPINSQRILGVVLLIAGFLLTRR